MTLEMNELLIIIVVWDSCSNINKKMCSSNGTLYAEQDNEMLEKSNSLSLNTLEKHKQKNIIRMLVCYILETYI